MLIFWRLFLAHLLADFTLQFDIVNRLKRKYIWGMVIHCLTHFVVSAALTYGYLGDVWFSFGAVNVNGWWALAVMLVVHFIVDELRLYGMRQLHYRDGTASFLADQFLHVYILFLISPSIPLDGGLFMAEKWTGLIAMSVLVTHVATVTIYFVEKDFSGRQFPGFDEKYFLIFERVVLWSFFFASGWWCLPFAAAWVAQLLYIRAKRIIDLSLTNIALSLALTSAIGLWTRYIYFGSLAG